jgi:CheY-like chemotaxis protein
MTGYSRAEDRDRAREAGIDDLRVKPIDLEDLDRWLESSTS